jgi:ABC transporter substrate binding protein (PQQ-dependent alcohol dehydrogenase system)
MINRCAALKLALIAGLAWMAEPAIAAGPANVTIGYVDLADDPAYANSRGYEGLLPSHRASPFVGAELAIADAKPVGQAVGVEFALAHVTLKAGDDPDAAIKQLVEEKKAVAVVLDLPLDETLKAATDAASRPIALLNGRHADPSLRQAACTTELFHSLPSWDMLEDALAQALVKRNWKRVLVIESDDPADKAVSAAFQASGGKFGLYIVAVRSFVQGEDPRNRDQNNTRLITAGTDYDVVFVADHQGDFARGLPFNTLLPRPVVGAAGLAPLAWHPLWDRDGAAQLQHRFFKSAKRPMTDLDWAAWAGVRAVVETVVAGKARSGADVIKALLSQDLTLELYKGEPGSFRPWNKQLRQPILLATDETVPAVAPVEGMLHRTNPLDTLGLDEPEFHCP